MFKNKCYYHYGDILQEILFFTVCFSAVDPHPDPVPNQSDKQNPVMWIRIRVKMMRIRNTGPPNELQ
jgi:hypothetical protein